MQEEEESGLWWMRLRDMLRLYTNADVILLVLHGTITTIGYVCVSFSFLFFSFFTKAGIVVK